MGITSMYIAGISQLAPSVQTGVGTWVLLSTTTLASNASLDLTSIPFYKKYKLIVSMIPSATSTTVEVTFNGDANQEYNDQYTTSTTTTVATSQATQYYTVLNKTATASTFGYILSEMLINNDTGATSFKTYFTNTFVGTSVPVPAINQIAGAWAPGTNATINRITLTPSAGNLGTGTVSLYGLVS